MQASSSSLFARCARLLLLLGAGCGRDTPPSNAAAPLGSEKQTDTKVLELGAKTLQNLSPVRSLDYYLDGFHVMKDEAGLHMEAHHFCKGMNEDFTQCVIFDGNTPDANIIGVEYIIAEALFEKLSPEEKPSWHPHNFEILSGQLVMPGLPDVAEKAALKKKLNSYGKTWHIWDTGHAGHPAADAMPIGAPKLAWSYNREGEMPESLVQARDQRMGIDTAAKKRDRADLAALARPQQGADAIRPVAPEK